MEMSQIVLLVLAGVCLFGYMIKRRSRLGKEE